VVHAPQDEVEAPPKKRRWRRRLLVTVIVLLLLIVAAPLALALPFVRGALADRIGDALGREVEIGGAFAFWGKGIDLDDVVVKSPPGFEEPLATVKHVHVDVDVLKLIGGGLDAEVLVVEPRVAFEKDAAGRSNADGLFGRPGPGTEEEAPAPAPTPEPEARRETPDLRLHVQVVDGVVRATMPPAKDVQELRDLDTSVEVSGDGALTVRLTAQAVGAAAGGGDAALRVNLALDGEGDGPVEVHVPALDLSRLSGIVEGASGITGLRGRLEANVDARARRGGRASGKLDVLANGLVLSTPSGLRFAVEKVTATATLVEDERGTKGDVLVRVEHAELLDESGRETRRFREPLVELVLAGRHDPEEETLLVESGRLAAGEALTVSASSAWEIRTGASPSARGELVVQADLGRLANLKGVVPALASLEAGRLGARLVAKAEDGLDVGIGIRALGLRLAPGEISPTGYEEPDLVLQARVLRAAGEGDLPVRVQLLGLTSRVATLRSSPGAEPFELSFAEAGAGGRGTTALDVDLGALGRAVGGLLGLGRTDALAGTLRLEPTADLAPAGGRASLVLKGRGVRLPDAWAKGLPPGSVDGDVRATVAEERVDLALVRLSAFGLTASGSAALARGAAPNALEAADVRVQGDLAQARTLLVPLVGLAPDARLAGRLDLEAHLVADGGARTLTGRTVVTGLTWHDGRGAGVLEEPRLEVVHDVALSTPQERTTRYELRRVEVVSQALKAKAEGTATTTGDEVALAATLTVDGDAGRLAGLLRSAFGDEYRDLRGQGPLQGTLRLDGGLAHGGESLRVKGSLKPGTWSAGGLTLAGATLSLDRADTREPLKLGLRGGVNGGRLDLELGVTLAAAANPWTLALELARVDTSPLVVDHGAGDYLTLFLPTLLPPDKASPVLNGLLDARIRVEGGDLGGPRLEPTLKGGGFVKMDQGSIGESTLFRTVGGGQGLGQVGTLLVRAVPEVGDVLGGLSKSLAFKTLESHFNLANRVVNVTQGLLDGERTRIDFRGTVGFNEVVNLKVDVTLSGKAGEKLQKVLSSKTIPLTVTGPMGSPRVAPGIDASKLARGALEGLLPGDGKNPLDGLKDLLPR